MTDQQQGIPYKLERIHADTMTPIGIFKQLSGQKKFLLESSFEHEKKGKYSYLGVQPYQEVLGFNNQTTVINLLDHTKRTYDMDAIHYLKEHFPKLELDLPLPFPGGAIGYIGYDTVRTIEPIGEEQHDELKMPDVHLMIYDELIIYEHTTESVYLLVINRNNDPESILDTRLKSLKKRLSGRTDIQSLDIPNIQFEDEMSEATFKEKVIQAKAYIEKGEAEQIVLSKRMKAPIHGDPLAYYRQLRLANPSPYMFYIDFSDYLIIGVSPESLVQTTNQHVVTNPIAGTRRRGRSPEEDLALMKELLADKKEVSEHDMLVDLSKQDLMKVCETDSITVPIYKEIEMYEHVMHIVSEVHGQMKKNMTSFDALLACLPAGTVSGSPKLRAMQIINELETEKRGFYGGGIGYIGFNHDVNMALAIRSLIIKNDMAYLQTGAGIVKDSDPQMEFLETIHKARSLVEVNKNAMAQAD